PFTEVVTAPYTVANGVLANYYDIQRPDAPPEQWVEAVYTDGRPMAGVLSSTDFHTRWRTTDSNRNRGRANAWTRAVLCYDFLTPGKAIAEADSISLWPVKRSQAGLTGQYLKDADKDFREIDRLHDFFLKDNLNAKDLVEEILMSPQYRVAGLAHSQQAVMEQ